MAKKISKPKGKVNRKCGYSLKEAMGLSNDEYNIIRVCFQSLFSYEWLR